MTFKEFDDYQNNLWSQVTLMRDTKGREYAHCEDRFANFNRLAKDLEMSNLKVAWVYLKKHLDSIVSFINSETTFSTEPIEGRFVDAITYLTLMASMVQEKQDGKTKGLKESSEVQLPLPFTTPTT